MISTPITCQYAEIALISDVIRTSKTFTSVAAIMNSDEEIEDVVDCRSGSPRAG